MNFLLSFLKKNGKMFGRLKLNTYFCSRIVKLNEKRNDFYTEQLLVVAELEIN